MAERECTPLGIKTHPHRYKSATNDFSMIVALY
jgi:hypothetical protein